MIETKRKAELFYIHFPWYRTFLMVNPKEYLVEVKCPVLALNGSKDLQIEAKVNLAGISESLTKGKNKHFELKEFEGLNRSFFKPRPMEIRQCIRKLKKPLLLRFWNIWGIGS